MRLNWWSKGKSGFAGWQVEYSALPRKHRVTLIRKGLYIASNVLQRSGKKGERLRKRLEKRLKRSLQEYCQFIHYWATHPLLSITWRSPWTRLSPHNLNLPYYALPCPLRIVIFAVTLHLHIFFALWHGMKLLLLPVKWNKRSPKQFPPFSHADRHWSNWRSSASSSVLE